MGKENKMKKIICVALVLVTCIFVVASRNSKIIFNEVFYLQNGKQVILHDDFTWSYYHVDPEDRELILQNKNTLRPKVNATDEEIFTACEMREQGWIYIMPQPKGEKAAWFNFDIKTVWYNGWWTNYRTGKYSKTTPVLKVGGKYEGDGIDMSNTFSAGGSPYKPDIYMFLLSDCGGPVDNCINLFHN